MDVRKIKKIMELVEAHGIAEIEISRGRPVHPHVSA